jgi:hypothetical protein
LPYLDRQTLPPEHIHHCQARNLRLSAS